MAPEVLIGPDYDEKVDIFSSGVIMYTLLTFRPVFPGFGSKDILAKNKKCVIEYPERYW